VDRRRLTALLFVILTTALAVAINLAPSQTFFGRDVTIRRGLDLQGGIQVLLRVAADGATAEQIATAAGVIEQRVNALGVGETVVQLVGSDRIIVELPGVADPERAIETLRGTGRLEFVNSQGQFLPNGLVVRTSGSPEPPQWLEDPASVPADGADIVYGSVTDGADLDTAQVQLTFTQPGATGSRPAVSFAFTGESARRLASFTSAGVGQPMCIVLDNTVISCPVVNSPLLDGVGVIEVSDQADATRIYNQLKYGALPVPLVVESSRTVTATLGEESVAASINAGIAGLLVVALFMTLFYRLPGLVATVALLIYTLISFAVYRLIPITLTLPGIAGFILSIGLAVDANVLIFARLREEFRRGKDFLTALELGFEESWPAIRDSSVSTIITSLVLFFFGNSFGVSIIKGFALTLGLGVVVSLFTALVVSRSLLRLLVPLFAEQRRAWFGIERDDVPATAQGRS
jgi:preprotein translocase subunit SecD